MLQINCSCGRIAEVRHRKNGKKLAYVHCVNGCGGLTNTVRATEIQAQAREDIGVKGEFFKPVSNDSSKTVQDKPTGDFKPDDNDLPEYLESDIKNTEDENEPTPAKMGNGLKVGIVLLVSAIFGGGCWQLSRLKG